MENLKSKIIPKSLKENIDSIMEEQLFNANRYYAISNPDISVLMEQEMFQRPESFLERLITRWEWHNEYYELLLEPAYEKIVKNKYYELSPKEIEEIIDIYSTSCLVDEATLVMSGSIKKYLDYICPKVSILDENLSKSESRHMLITPPTETFFAQYQIDHLYYIYLIKTKDKDSSKYKEYLKNKYHANDEIIFNSRFEKKFKSKLNMAEKEILKEIKEYSISKAYKTKHLYFTLEHAERKAIRDIILYDNLNEKLISSNLIGISGFLLRKKILEYLNESKILQNDGYIYQFSNETIIDSLRILQTERRNSMDKDIKPYKQRGDTCAIACMMMALEYYKTIPKANWYDERRLYKIYRSKYIAGTPFSALAYHLSKNGLNTAIYHSDNNLFNNDLGVLNETDFNLAMNEYKEYLNRAISTGAKVINGIDFNSKLLKEKLQNGNIVILAGEIVGIYHAILLSGYKDDKFIVCDPMYKEKQYKTEKEIEEFMDTSIGKWFITVNDSTKEKEILMSNIDKYQNEANELMKKKTERSLKYVKK